MHGRSDAHHRGFTRRELVKASGLVTIGGLLASACGPIQQPEPVVEVDPASKEQLAARLKLLRPLSPTTPSHALLLDNLRPWLANVLLGGRRYELTVAPEAVFQIASQRAYYNKFGIYFYDEKFLNRLLADSPICDKTFDAQLRAWAKTHPPAHGVLMLTKHISHAPNYLNKPRDDRRFLIKDVYKLDLYDADGVPMCSVRSDCIVPFYVIDRPFDFTKHAVPWFPEPDNVVLSWHEAQPCIELPWNGVYAVACFQLAGFRRRIDGQYGPYRSDHWDSADKETVYENPEHADEALAATLPTSYTYSPTMGRLYHHFLIHDVEVQRGGGWEIVPRDRPAPPPPAVTRTTVRFFDLPQPKMRAGSSAEKAVVKFVRGFSNPTHYVGYLGAGLFTFKSSSIATIAAKSEMLSTEVDRSPLVAFRPSAGERAPINPTPAAIGVGETILVFGAKAGPVGAAVESGASLAGAVYAEELGRDARDYYSSQDHCKDTTRRGDCLNCFDTAKSKFRNVLEKATASGVGGLVGIGMGAATSYAAVAGLITLGPAGWTILGLAVLAGGAAAWLGGAVAYDAYESINEIDLICDGKRP